MIDASATTTLIYFQQLLTGFGLPAPAGEPSASITVDDRLTLQITALDDGQMTLITPLAGEDKELTPAFARRLLEANFLRRGTREAVFGLAQGKPVLLRTLNPGQLTYPEFRQVVEDFVNTADTWAAANAASQASPTSDAVHHTAHYLSA
jgi:hypothetical protein